MTYRFHTDPGHGWLEVDMGEVKRLCIGDRISRYSYTDGHKAYLEEDCDAGVFIEAKKARGEVFQCEEVLCGRDHWIRKLSRFEA